MARTNWQRPGEDQRRSNGIVEIYTGVVDIGTGAKTTMAMIASKVLRVPLESMNVTWGDTEVTPNTVGEMGSTTTTFAGTAVREAAKLAKTKLLELSSAQFGTSELELDSGYVTSRDGRKRMKDRRYNTKVRS